MPIRVEADIVLLDDEQFNALVYDVMRQIFDVHNELGRLFEEKIYHREIAFRVPDAQTEVAIDVEFEDFRKNYYLDLLVAGGAIFELKAVDSLAEIHRRQLLNYLFFTGLPHGKLVNLRSQKVEHEYVNNILNRKDRTAFAVVQRNWRELEGFRLMERMVPLLRDWGTGLNLGLYEEAALHFCGLTPEDEAEVAVRRDLRCLGVQRMHLVAPDIALRITALPADHRANYQTHLSRLLEHTDLRAVQWINITRSEVCFETVFPEKYTQSMREKGK